MTIVFVGIDLAKSVFAVHGVDEHGKPALVRPKVARAKLAELVAALPACTIGLEACSGAHHWARLFTAMGHTVRLIAPKFVSPYRMSGKRGKNDAADAAAICEAVQRPTMRFVPIKNVEQQAQLTLHRMRQGFIEQRTATINRIRGLLSEFGIVLPLKAATVRREAALHLEDLPGWANLAIGDGLSELHRLDERIEQYDRHLAQVAQQDARVRQPIGPKIPEQVTLHDVTKKMHRTGQTGSGQARLTLGGLTSTRGARDRNGGPLSGSYLGPHQLRAALDATRPSVEWQSVLCLGAASIPRQQNIDRSMQTIRFLTVKGVPVKG